jgi:hypothetical protein
MSGMKNRASAAVAAVLLLCAAAAWGETRLLFHGSTGLSTDGLNGYLGEKHPKERIVVQSDESPVYLLFFWDSKDLQPVVSVSGSKGEKIAEIDLSKGNIVTFKRPGRYVCTLSARRGSGHWFCVLLGGREWDP